MPQLHLLSAKKMIKILFCLGFEELRTKGSHHFFFNPDTKKTATVPVHGNEYLSIGILKEILKDIDLSMKEYEKLRQKI
ncbi:type II toxin-antitoxin system HicA family toxin [Patescibacteria group bacterium]|nr:type II toxin-antitoxin system HicA family toxin [Patescibacteria group bacterium]MBU2632941.1 type II toxin-antitoxin system HicA family toxin [Patescibacteria group bacterium]